MIIQNYRPSNDEQVAHLTRVCDYAQNIRNTVFWLRAVSSNPNFRAYVLGAVFALDKALDAVAEERLSYPVPVGGSDA